MTVQDSSFEVGEQDKYFVAADVDAEHVSGVGVEAVAAGRPTPLPSGSTTFNHPSVTSPRTTTSAPGETGRCEWRAR
ncbi:hypothetical protein AB0M44_38475 [Streptosporangium subroseum]|uniref:hypothetical protein n=1 Tax=Streptosporangium subroseum TaxID=106412 RepID=UPI0034484EE9